MKINSVVGAIKNISVGNINFKRALREEEKKDYTKSLEKAMDYLGVQNRALIIHGPSFPASMTKNVDQKVGSPYNSEEFLDFLKLHGFNSVQLGPTGKLSDGDNSPYVSSIFAKNPLFIDFTELTTPKFASILSEEDLLTETYEVDKTKENYTRTDFNEAKVVQARLMELAYDGFVDKLSKKDNKALELNKEFQSFQKDNEDWLDYYSVLETITKKYGTDYYPDWSLKDRHLISGVQKKDANAVSYYNEIKKEKARDIDLYKFTQFVIDKQAKADAKNRKDFVYISDLLVGASKYDELIYEDAFMKDYKIGAAWGGQFDSPQLWGISVLNPSKIFNKDGSLGTAGKFIKTKVKKSMQNAQNLRVDHAMGLVDPYIYKESSVVYGEKKDKTGKLVSYPLRDKLVAGYMSQLGFDPHQNYQKIISKIVIPEMKKMGLNPKDIVWEDLGSDETGVFNRVFRKENHLPGITGLAWSRGEESPRDNWAYIGCHDDRPARKSVEMGLTKNTHAWNPDYLAGYLNPSPKRAKQREQFKKNILNRPQDMVKAKFADLFRSTKNIQISFMDFFGINKQYNVPGTSNDENWTLRVNPNYEETYHKSLENSDSFALNMPEILSIAVQAKSDMDYAKGEKTEKQAQEESRPILQKLNHYSQILKEKE